MIYITGDVHFFNNRNWEQKQAGSELDAVIEYLKILKKNKLKSTLFINGICLEKEPDKVKKIIKFDTEIGGHTYNNFGKKSIIKSYINRKIFGCVYGFKLFQERDIIKTKKAFEKLNINMKSWRTHAFASNEKTFELLRKHNIKYVSDLFDDKPFENKGLIHIPINIPVDQNVISYGLLTPKNRNPFASCVKSRIKPLEWLDIVKQRVKYNEKNNLDSVLLIHPITMKVLDNFKIFKDLCRFLNKYDSGKISDIRIK